MGKFEDLTGRQFGRLEVLHRDLSRKGQYWICRCSCAEHNIKSIRVDNLKSGDSKSCGCIVKENNLKRSTHNLSKNKFYNAWNHIRNRCNNKNDKTYDSYGGRGIQFCKEWEDSVELFIAYVSQLENANDENYSIDRINNNGNYEPGNIKWSTRKEQSRNRMTTILTKEIVDKMKDMYKTMSCQDIAKEYNIHKDTVWKAVTGRTWNE